MGYSSAPRSTVGDQLAHLRRDADLVVAAERLDPERVVGRLAAGDAHQRGEAVCEDFPAGARHLDHVRRLRPVHDDGVGLAIATAAERPEADVDGAGSGSVSRNPYAGGPRGGFTAS